MKHPRPHSYFRRRIINPLLALLTMGITPQKLALTVAFGVVVGIMPLFGLATLLCTLLGLRFRLNIPALLLICYLVAPIHLLLYLPFIRMGILIFGADEFRMTFEQLLIMFKEDWLDALEKVWLANLLGVAVWLLLSIPITALVYFITLPIFRKYVRVPKRNLISDIPI
ncbi:DUF2062 domain-containing protein [Adhaeribacter rhizoryzae]|uniref:DUF2062 domain-containing protein n=1 Tax=Adhaeribacter rhizoryzae TaxID=2607907 RepID=A0A5M6DPW2_9BACT|nr:DUF2062 domain-containing protein [Adhaeribacter rhizoryzae]KAA5548282.1 DUF2062 domain-containing protein [Adhaeribacter rhizoryzae]